MKVKELIEKLKTYPQNMEVKLSDKNIGSVEYDIYSIDIEQDSFTEKDIIIIYSDIAGT